MAASRVLVGPPHARPAASAKRATWTARRLRLTAGVVVAYALLQTEFGLVWDVLWHAWILRDRFWTPPHLLIYSGVAGAGLTCLGLVLWETWRYRRGALGADVGTTVAVGPFRAPRGFVVAGCGLLVMAHAAPLDNMWHAMYGFDLTLWSPFHVMGVVGLSIACLGTTYLFAALAAQERHQGSQGPRRTILGWPVLGLAALFALSELVQVLLIVAEPAWKHFPTTTIGPFAVLTYPILLAGAVVVPSVAAVTMARRPGAATILMGMVALVALPLALFAPWGVNALIAQGGYAVHAQGRPAVNLRDLLLPLTLLGPAVAIDLIYACGRRRWDVAAVVAGIVGGAIAAAIALLFVQEYTQYEAAARAASLLNALYAGSEPANTGAPAGALGLGGAGALFVGAIGAWVARGLGMIWRLSE